MKLNRKRKGFTLIETVTTLFIISLLAMLIIPNVENVRQSAQRRQSDALVKLISGQVALYFEDGKRNTVSIKELVASGYLTQEQANTANNAHIVIKDNQVKKEA